MQILHYYGYDHVYTEPEHTMFRVIQAPDDIGIVQYKNFLFKRSDMK